MSVIIRLRLNGPPEIEAHGADIEEASETLRELRNAGAFNAVKAIAREYQEAPEAGLESARTSFPEARVIEEREVTETEKAVASQPPRRSSAPLRV